MKDHHKSLNKGETILMLKIINFILIIIMLSSETEAQFIRIWEKSASLGNLPSWFSTTSNLQRGIAYTFTPQERLLVITDPNVPKVIVLNALTGDSVGTLNTSGISGGQLALSDISTVSGFPFFQDFFIYACNLTQNAAADPFKIYMWTDVNSAPQLVVVDSLSNFRLGERLNVTDNFFSWPERHLTTGSSGSNKIVDYISPNINPPFTRNVITLSDGIQGDNLSAVFDLFLSSNGGYLVNSDNRLPRIYNTSGLLQYISPDSAITPSTNSIKFFINLLIENPIIFNDFYVTYNYNAKYADLILSPLLHMEDHWAHTPSLGTNPHPTNFGDVEYFWRTYDTLYVFVLSGNNGLGAYYALGAILPTELIFFTAEKDDPDILLQWITASEINNKGFEIERRSSGQSNWESIGFVEGRGTTTERTNYSFRNKNISPGQYYYRLKQINFDGSFEYSVIFEINAGMPDVYILMQNFPNPFNPVTNIKFSIAEAGLVNLSVYNLLGQKTAELKNEVLQPGNYEAVFNASSLPSGVYVYKLNAGGKVISRKMLLIK